MNNDLRVGVIGTCLSNLTAVHLMSDFQFPRLNNAAVSTGGHFIETVIEGRDVLPPFETMRRYLDLPEDDANDSFRYLNENYRASAGLTEIGRDGSTLWQNIENKQFDLLLLDNLCDGYHRLFETEVEGQAARFHFPHHLSGENSPIRQSIRETPHVTAEESCQNWRRILEWAREMQPEAQIIFSLPFSCTSLGDERRMAFYRDFNDIFPDAVAGMDMTLLPELSPDPSLWKLPDWKHFDLRVYRGLAGFLYTRTVSGWDSGSVAMGGAKLTEARLAPWAPVPALRGLLADTLGVDAARVGEDAGLNRTENWDSLKQVEVMASVEKGFGIRASFDETMNASNVPAIREALAQRGIAAEDDPAATSNIFHSFVTRAQAAPEALYARFMKQGATRDLTYGALLSDVAAVQSAIGDLEPGAVVAIILDHSPQIYPAFIGSVLGGWVPTMLPPLTRKQDPAVFAREIEVLFGRVRPAVVITRRDFAGLIPPGTGAVQIHVEDLSPVPLADALEQVAVPTPAAHGTLAFLQHSSGTTGHKKGVMLTHDQVYHQARTYAQAIGMQTGDKLASWLPLYHDMGLLTSFIIPTIIGCPLISMDALEWVTNPTMLLDAIEENRAAYCWLPNFAFHHIVRAADPARQWKLGSMKALISCSEPCRLASFDEFAARFGAMGLGLDKLGTCYAMAENVFGVTQSRLGEAVRAGPSEASRYLRSGRPLSDVELEIRIDGVVQPEGTLGTVWLRSPSMFSGYLHLAELTAEKVVDGWYNTHDLGVIENGELTVVGRADDLIIISGKNVVAHELEDELNAVAGVAPGRILAYSRYDEASALTELIIAAEPAEPGVDVSALENDLRELTFSLCGVAPRKVLVVERGFLIKSTSGKIARAKSEAKLEQARLDLLDRVV